MKYIYVPLGEIYETNCLNWYGGTAFLALFRPIQKQRY